MTKLRWGIISTGRMARWFCNDFHQVIKSVLGAVCSRSESAANQFADTYNIQHRFTELDALLESGEIDVAYVATPHTTHKDILLTCFDRSISVLCE